MNHSIHRVVLAVVFAVQLCRAAPALDIIVDDADAGFLSVNGLGVPIFMYHGLDSAFGFNAADFVAQMDWLAAGGFHTITLDHLKSWIQTGSPALPPKPIVLTFDDNYITIYTVAYPTLGARGFTGVNFVHTAYVGVVTSYDHADWNEINEMETSGVIFTESHTVNHVNLTTVNTTTLNNELVNSKTAIESHMPGKTCRHLSYPYGGYNTTVIARTQAAGYLTAVTTNGGVNNRSTPLFELRRYGINPDTAAATFQSSANAGLTGGVWAAGSSQSDYYGVGYHSAAAGNGQSVGWWMFTPPQTGLYMVYARWTTGAGNASGASYVVHHTDGDTGVLKDQSVNGGQWMALGQFTFSGGRQTWITLANNNAGGTVIADAIRLSSVTQVDDWHLY